MNATDLPDPLRDLPPSAKFVYNRLKEADRELTREQIQRRTGLPKSTALHALDRLEARGLVKCHPWLPDVSKPCYEARPVQ